MRWTVEVDPAIAPSRFYPVAPEDVWAPSRLTAAAPVEAYGEAERFIFYRGLGDFDLPLRVLADAPGALTVALGGDAPVPAAFALDVSADGGALVALGALAPGAAVTVTLPERLPLAAFVAAAKDTLRDALVADGLYTDEAQAMVDTWDHSYLRTLGTRLLYVAPRAWTDAILPLAVTPTPDELVRTMIGRIEVTTRADELALLADVALAADEHGDDLDACLITLYGQHGRLVEARLRAAARANTDPSLTPVITALIEHASGPFFGLTPPPGR